MATMMTKIALVRPHSYKKIWHEVALYANCSKTVKDTNFKFDKHVHRDSPDIIPRKIFEKRAWPGSRDSPFFWALNANCSNTVKDTDIKFDNVARDSPDMTPEKFRKGSVARVM